MFQKLKLKYKKMTIAYEYITKRNYYNANKELQNCKFNRLMIFILTMIKKLKSD